LNLSISRHTEGHDLPPVQKIKASHEIAAFSSTLEVLFRIIRSANIAFFNGELDFAYRVLNDALRLFRRLDNKKAIGIASNNLGNTLLGIYRAITAAKLQKLHGLTKDDIVALGIAHFHNAIQMGEKAYDEFYELQGWSPSCLDFMQHLANRYFNRGLFLLHIKRDHPNPKEIEQLGRRDIQIACDMDQEVVTYSEEIGWGTFDRAEKRFNVNISRIRGFNILSELGYNNDWGVEELIEETLSIVREERKNPETDFFSNMSIAGRLQDLDVQIMRYHANRGDYETAAKVAVRMLIEDERLFIEAMRQALAVLIKFAENGKADPSFRRKLVPVLRTYRKTVMEMINERRQSAVEDMDSLSASLTKSLTGSVLNRERGRLSNTTTDESSRFVTMEDF
jgi:tetratricopeptide (TPR) repeat protein